MLCSVRKKKKQEDNTYLPVIAKINRKNFKKQSSIGTEEKSGRGDKERSKTSLTLRLYIILIFFLLLYMFSIIQKIKLTEKGKKGNIQFKTTQNKLKYISNF